MRLHAEGLLSQSFRAGPFISRIRKIGVECGLPAGQPKCLVLSPSMNSPLLRSASLLDVRRCSDGLFSLLDDVLEVEDAKKKYHGDDDALAKVQTSNSSHILIHY